MMNKRKILKRIFILVHAIIFCALEIFASAKSYTPNKDEIAFIKCINDIAVIRGGWKFINEDGWNKKNELKKDSSCNIVQGLKSPQSTTLAGFAAINGYLDALRLILEKGGDINVRDSEGETPLHKAAYLGHTETAKFLIEKGADVNAKQRDGMTPLHLTIFFLRIDTAKLLIENKAELNSQNASGKTPLFILRNFILSDDKGLADMDQLLSRHGAKAEKGDPQKQDEKYNINDASNAKTLLKQGIEKHKAGQFNEALKLYRLAKRLSVGNNEMGSELYFRSAESYMSLKEYGKALTDSSMAILLNETDCKSYQLRGKIYRIKGNNKEADEDRKKIIDLGCNR